MNPYACNSVRLEHDVQGVGEVWGVLAVRDYIGNLNRRAVSRMTTVVFGRRAIELHDSLSGIANAKASMRWKAAGLDAHRAQGGSVASLEETKLDVFVAPRHMAPAFCSRYGDTLRCPEAKMNDRGIRADRYRGDLQIGHREQAILRNNRYTS